MNRKVFFDHFSRNIKTKFFDNISSIRDHSVYRNIKRYLFINVLNTPNPNALKFVPGLEILQPNNTLYFDDKNKCGTSPLARQLFDINGVSTVMFGPDFISITKHNDVEWSILKPIIFAVLTDYFKSGQNVLYDSNDVQNAYDSQIVKEIKQLLDSKIRPIIQEDGGDIVFHSFDESTGIVRIKLQGACTNCPSSTITLQNGVKNMIKFFFPQVTDVQQVSDEVDEKSDEIFQQLEHKLKRIKNIDDIKDKTD